MSTRIYLHKVGQVSEEFSDKVIRELKSFYDLISKKGIKTPALVDVIIYEDLERTLRSLELEAMERGVSVLNIFPIMHEVWRGLPRIHIVFSALKNLRWKIIRTLLIHEACHSILHSQVKYYIVTLDLPNERYALLTTLASTIVKDLDVIKFLKEVELEDVINDYIDYVSDDVKAWKCDSIPSLFELAKLLVPYIVYFNGPEGLSDPLCKKLSKSLINVLKMVSDLDVEFDVKVNILMEELLKIAVRFGISDLKG